MQRKSGDGSRLPEKASGFRVEVNLVNGRLFDRLMVHAASPPTPLAIFCVVDVGVCFSDPHNLAPRCDKVVARSMLRKSML